MALSGALIAILVGCRSAGPVVTPAPPMPTVAPTPSAAATTAATPRVTSPPAPQMTLNDDFQVAADGRSLHMWCLGSGSPTVILEAGHPSGGFDQFLKFGRSFTMLVARDRRVCLYDRAGYGVSDLAPNEPRDLDDVTGDLHALLAAAEIDGPLVLVGSSFGGFIDTYYAHRFPEGVVGVVLLDVPAPSATLSLEQVPELAWDHPSNPEHLDVVPEFENRLATERFPFEAPLLVIVATDGQSSLDNGSFWLDWSDESRIIELPGDHVVYQRSPREIRDEILKFGSQP